jgi:hypothetical protein
MFLGSFWVRKPKSKSKNIFFEQVASQIKEI